MEVTKCLQSGRATELINETVKDEQKGIGTDRKRGFFENMEIRVT